MQVSTQGEIGSIKPAASIEERELRSASGFLVLALALVALIAGIALIKVGGHAAIWGESPSSWSGASAASG